MDVSRNTRQYKEFRLSCKAELGKGIINARFSCLTLDLLRAKMLVLH